MVDNKYKKEVSSVINLAKQKGKVKKYEEYNQTIESEKLALSEEEKKYYITTNEKNYTKYDIGDIVFVSAYLYKNGTNGKNHAFVIINDNQAIDINYFGFLLSSKINKSSYPFNEKLNKNKTNNLYKNSIVKCDYLIEISEKEIKFKIGRVEQEDLERFLKTYKKYLTK